MLKNYSTVVPKKIFIRKKARNLNKKPQKKFLKNFLNFFKKYFFAITYCQWFDLFQDNAPEKISPRDNPVG